jgi:hypothetical protein|tara:strand:+ start:1163 stop:1885 length:723 start_codon:yes stop_codon:yes gene_type:complete
MSSEYKQIKHFIASLDTRYTLRKTVGKKILKDIKYKQKRRCPCRVLDKYKLNINQQCPNAVYTINNICYNCDKNHPQLGFVYEYPTKDIIKKYVLYSKKYNITFSVNNINLGVYKKYINQYIKLKITDYSTCSEIILFKVPIGSNDDNYDEEFGEQGTLIDKYYNVIGSYDTWTDYGNTVSDTFTNDLHQILDPIDNIPLLRYNLMSKSIYHTLTNRVYKKYRFSASKDTMYLTNDVIDN